MAMHLRLYDELTAAVGEAHDPKLIGEIVEVFQRTQADRNDDQNS